MRMISGIRRGWLAALLLAGAVSISLAVEPDIRRDAVVNAVEQVLPSVVNIATRTPVVVHNEFEAMQRQLFGLPNSYISVGSGVVIDEAGFLLTNDHVIRGASQIGVKFCFGTNVYEAEVIASDPKTDVALLRLKSAPGERFQAIKFAPEDDLLLGETVLALGNPFGLGGSVSRGILSSKSRLEPVEGESLKIRNWLQTDAAINPGNSGGPLVNLRGELIGINVEHLQNAQSIGFAIPIKEVLVALSDILPTEFVKSYWFGARIKVGSSPLVVTTVQPESPAGQAGLKPGDLILRVNGQAPRSFIDFGNMVAHNADSLSLAVQRGTDQHELHLQLVMADSVFNATMVQDKLGLSLNPVVLPMPMRFRDDAATGFNVTDVQPDSPAQSARIQKGMVLIAIDGQSPENVTALAKLLYSKKKGEPTRLYVAAVQQQAGISQLLKGSVDLFLR